MIDDVCVFAAALFLEVNIWALTLTKIHLPPTGIGFRLGHRWVHAQDRARYTAMLMSSGTSFVITKKVRFGLQLAQ